MNDEETYLLTMAIILSFIFSAYIIYYIRNAESVVFGVAWTLIVPYLCYKWFIQNHSSLRMRNI